MVNEIGIPSESQSIKIKECIVNLISVLNFGKLIDLELKRDRINNILWVSGEFEKLRDNRSYINRISIPIYNWSQLEFPL